MAFCSWTIAQQSVEKNDIMFGKSCLHIYLGLQRSWVVKLVKVRFTFLVWKLDPSTGAAPCLHVCGWEKKVLYALELSRKNSICIYFLVFFWHQSHSTKSKLWWILMQKIKSFAAWNWIVLKRGTWFSTLSECSKLATEERVAKLQTWNAFKKRVHYKLWRDIFFAICR